VISGKGTSNSPARLVPEKNPINASRKEKLAKQSPIGLWTLGIVLFVVVGGVFFEAIRLIFL